MENEFYELLDGIVNYLITARYEANQITEFLRNSVVGFDYDKEQLVEVYIKRNLHYIDEAVKLHKEKGKPTLIDKDKDRENYIPKSASQVYDECINTKHIKTR